MELPELPDLQSSELLLWYNSPPVHDIAARAYIKKGVINKAIAEYERIAVFDPNSPDRRMILPRYRYSLARLYEQQGMKEKAVKEYERFLTLWKDADPDLAEIKDARLRLTGLKAGQRK